jgi:adenosine kinase
MRIAFSGSIAFDYLMRFPGSFRDNILQHNLEALSLSFLVDSMTKHRGGTAPNIAYTHALLGGNATVVGAVGEDFTDYQHWLTRHNVRTDGVRKIDGLFTASFFCTTDQNNNQIASFSPGAMAHSSQLRLTDLPYRPDLVVISPDDPTAMRERVRECKALGIPYLYDVGQQIVRLDVTDIAEGVDGAHILIVNDYEFSLLHDKLGLTPEKVVAQNTVLVITRGEAGSTLYVGGQEFQIGIFPATRIEDPTGAGDAFRGAFLRGYALGLPWELCGKMGALASTYSLENLGPTNHHYTPSQFIARFRSYWDDLGQLNPLS